ncbi:hypothetical protein P4637_01450 [Halalkalibacterium halodurans]|uniref:BH1806 protein n=2 Tax=Halalkalibacterium halodurans TaxID=86665 RepID=Q9KBW8_HALH5|nr:hypothetical protein [Halalkalibacterium halodurans]MDY7222366.1 hypothetical protein [Halalkalibacterium halodurans]MDY7241587.1 hypothetical protein [Halalkalibacterium halodurans]MED3648880.1 hypothetical protein [Halalkalibacterium halodurans]MED4082327.1 hypothetical protein [Halalkalibacterium halodurans]MED4083522.1 hypothetical protein [Halalkalibacterium halodurans]
MGVIVYKCLNCGGPLEFKAESQKWECEYCLSDFSAEDMKRFEDEQKSQAVAEMDTETIEKEKGQEIEFVEKAKSYSCKSCGAEIVTKETTAATFCYYCHNPTIIPGQLSGDYRPAQVIPFQITKEQAEESFVQWCNKKPLLSKYFTFPSQLEKLSGIYVPFWLFDCDTLGSIDAEATKSRSYTRGNMRYTETKYYRVIREGRADYRKVPADGSTKMDEKLMGGLEPYDYADLKDFSMSYLSGYLAEKYDLNQNDVYGRISDVIRQHTSSLLRQTIKGYGSVSIKDSSFNIKKVDATYVLLPVWMFTYQYKGKTYVFAMNGQTGKISGNLPISMKRAAAWFGIVTGASFLTMLIGGWVL